MVAGCWLLVPGGFEGGENVNGSRFMVVVS